MKEKPDSWARFYGEVYDDEDNSSQQISIPENEVKMPCVTMYEDEDGKRNWKENNNVRFCSEQIHTEFLQHGSDAIKFCCLFFQYNMENKNKKFKNKL